MYKSFVASLFGLMTMDVHVSENSFEDSTEEKRRLRKIVAARKSYAAKEKERQNLQQRNSDLMKTQMKLLHEKSRLEERIRQYQFIVNNMNHIHVSCRPSSEQGPTTCTKIDANSEGIVLKRCISDSEPLDLSIHSKLFKFCADYKSRNNSKCHHKSAILGDKTTGSWDDHVLDPSTLELGATQEVHTEISLPRKKTRHDKSSASNSLNDNTVFPILKKIKQEV